MKKVSLFTIGWLLACLLSKYSLSQNTQKGEDKVKAENADAIKKAYPADIENESQEIIIKKKGRKVSKILVEIGNDKIMINGKPLAEFNEDSITINNKKIIINDGNNFTLKIQKQIDDDIEKNFEQQFDVERYFSYDINGEPISDEKSFTYLGVSSEKCKEGAKILSVEKESPAIKAGLLEGDIIYKIDDKNVQDNVSLKNIITKYKYDDKVTVYILRDGKKKNFKVNLAIKKINIVTYKNRNRKKIFAVPPAPPAPPFPPSVDNIFDNGDEVIIDVRRKKIGIKIEDTQEENGVKIVEVETESPAAKAGLLSNDIITEIDNKKVINTGEARQQMFENESRKSYKIKAMRNGKEMDFNITIPRKLKTAEL